MTNPRPALKVSVDALGRGRVAIDGQDISRCVSAFEIKGAVGDVTEVKLSLIGTELDLDLETELRELRVHRPAARSKA